jgi:hypothetical protein
MPHVPPGLLPVRSAGFPAEKPALHAIFFYYTRERRSCQFPVFSGAGARQKPPPARFPATRIDRRREVWYNKLSVIRFGFSGRKPARKKPERILTGQI